MTVLGAPAPQDVFTDNHRWGDLHEWNQTAIALHEQGGIHRIERDGFPSFWAVIDHAAVLEIEKQPELFTNGPEPVLQTTQQIEGRQAEIKSLIHMDAPEHNKYRKLISAWFKPRTVGALEPRLDELSAKALKKLEDAQGSIDFAVDIALPYPLEVVLAILGLPESDYPRMLMLTQQLFGQEDPDLQRGEVSAEVQAQVIQDFNTYFAELTASRKANPTDDLASVIANGIIDDEGVRALIENPDQLAKLQADPDTHLNNTVEEVLRWTAPVRHFMRTAQADTEILGQKIAKGEWIYLSYKAANLDPKVFDNPLTFDIERDNASSQISFGYGVHFCLGAQLARLEIRSLLGHVVNRLASVELAGDPTTMKTTFVGGHKTLPISYKLN